MAYSGIGLRNMTVNLEYALLLWGINPSYYINGT